MRIRSVKPEFWISRTVAGVSLAARLTFIGLWNYSDDEGRGIDDARLIKAAIWPLDDDVTRVEVEDYLDELAIVGLIRRYVIDERNYYDVPSWREHQKIDRPKTSAIPARTVVEDSATDRRAIDDGSLLEGNREQGTGNGAGKEQGAPHFLVAKYLDKLKAEPGGDVWAHVDAAAITDAGADFGLDALAVGQVLGDVWLWWHDAVPSKRWKKQPLRGLRTWIRRNGSNGQPDPEQDAEDVRLSALPGKLEAAIRHDMAADESLGLGWPIEPDDVAVLVARTLERFPDGPISHLMIQARRIAGE